MSCPRSPDFCILVGFDRSGTSFCSQLLAEHPDIECFMQPFSSTLVHETEWTSWGPEESYPEVEDFMSSLQDGYVTHSFLASDWFEKHSSTQQVQQGKLHVIKSTKLHHKIEWFQSHFPDIKIWGLDRNIKGILCSLFRNDFYEKWYGDEEFQRFLEQLSTFDYPQDFTDCVMEARTGLEKMTCMAAGRIWAMYRSLPADRILSYESLVETPDEELSKILPDDMNHTVSFSDYIDEDYNIIGKQHKSVDYWRTYFTHEEQATIDQIRSTLSFKTT